MITLYSKKNCIYCNTVEQALIKIGIPYHINYDHNEKIVPQGFNSNGDRLFMGIPEFNLLKEIKKTYEKN